MVERRVSVRFSAEGGKQVRSEAEGIRLAIGQVHTDIDRQSKSAASSADVFTAALDREEDAFRAIRSAVDPAYAAQMRYVDAAAAVEQAVRSGVATERESISTLALLEQRYLGVAQAADQAATATQRRIGAAVGLGSAPSSGGAAASAGVFEEAAREAAAMDRLRQSFDSSYAATRRYQEAQETLRRAVALGVTTQEEANRVLAQAKERLLGAGTATAQAATASGMAMQGARVDAANLGYQFNDIAVMMAAGQNPFMLAIQQGTQISQVLGPMGARGAVQALGGAFLSFLNPVTLVTVGVIAAGAAFIQAFTDGEGKAASLEDALGTLDGALARIKAANDSYTFESVQEAIDKYGEWNTEVVTLNDNLARNAAIAARNAAREALSAVREEITGGFFSSLFSSDSGQIADFLGVENSITQLDDLGNTIRVINPQVIQFRDALDAATRAEGFEAQADALAVLSELIKGTTLDGTEFSTRLLDAQATIREMVQEAEGLPSPLTDSAGSAKDAAKALEDATRSADALGLATGDLPPILREADAFALDFASRWDEATRHASAFRGIIESLTDPIGTMGAALTAALAPLRDSEGWAQSLWDRLGEYGESRAAFSGGDLVSRIIGVESGGNASADNPNSSALGLGQFIESTWLQMFKEHFPDRAEGMTDAAILALREDAALSRSMVELYLQGNAEIMRRAGVAVTDANLYLAHFLGPGGAVALLQAPTGTSVSSVLGADQVAANSSILSGRTREEVIAWAQRKVGISEVELSAQEAATAAQNAAASRDAAEAARERATATREAAQAEAEGIRLTEAARASLDGLIQSINPAAETAAQFAAAQDTVNQNVRLGLITLAEGQAVMQAYRDYTLANSDAVQAQREALEGFSDVSRDVFGGMIDDALAGASALEVLSNAFTNVGSRILDSGLDAIFGGEGGGLFGGWLGGAMGGRGGASGGLLGGGVAASPAAAPGMEWLSTLAQDDGRRRPRRSPALPEIARLRDRPSAKGSSGAGEVLIRLSDELVGEILSEAEGQSVRIAGGAVRKGLADYDRGPARQTAREAVKNWRDRG